MGMGMLTKREFAAVCVPIGAGGAWVWTTDRCGGSVCVDARQFGPDLGDPLPCFLEATILVPPAAQVRRNLANLHDTKCQNNARSKGAIISIEGRMDTSLVRGDVGCG